MADKSIHIVEQPTNIALGLIEELWKSRDEYPRMKGFSYFAYFLQQGFHTIKARFLSNVVAILTIAVSLFLLGGLLLAFQNVDILISRVGNTLDVTAYLKEDSRADEAVKIIDALKLNPKVESVDYVSKERALELFKETLGATILEGIEQENPLPASIEVRLKQTANDQKSIEELVSNLKLNPSIAEVAYGSEWVDKVQKLLQTFRFISVGVFIVVLLVVLFIIISTIGLVIVSRKHEIEIMQLVGASENFIRIPFFFSGLIQGFLGSALGILLLGAGFRVIDAQIQNSVILGVTLPSLQFFNIITAILIVLLGMFVGAVGSFLALGRFLNV